jgi:hypothetical protein
MSLKSLKELKKQPEVKKNQFYKKYLLVGSDSYLLNLFLGLKERFSLEKVHLVSEVQIKNNDLNYMRPFSIRGELNMNFAKKILPEQNLEQGASLFFKDGKFRSFSGRSKPFELLEGEQFFSLDSLNIKEVSSISSNGLEGDVIYSQPVVIRKKTPEDLIDPTNWEVEFSNGDICSCEHLIWGQGELSFYELLDKSNSAAHSISSLCEGLNKLSVLYVQLDFPEPVTEHKECLLIPLSFTHDQGHYIGEFTNEGRTGEFIHYFDHTSENEEEVSRKFRNLKRCLERAFGFSWSDDIEEYIKVYEAELYEAINDEAFQSSEQDLKGLFFVGESAPLGKKAHELWGESFAGISHMARGMASLEVARHQFLQD